MTLLYSFSPAAGYREWTKSTLTQTGLGVAFGAPAENLQLRPVTHWDGGSAAVAMSEVDAPVIVGSIGEDGMLSIDLSAPQGTRGVPLPRVRLRRCGGGEGKRYAGDFQRLGC